MKAVFLVGGQGTRLRPLTLTTPKSLIPLVNRPFQDHLLHLLRSHGITDVVLAMGYLSAGFEEAYGDGSHLGMKLTYVHEEEPLDTGGAIKNVQAHLTPGETFFVFNGDVLTDLDLTDMLRLHRECGSVCTISLTPVEDPSAYGVVDLDEAGRIERFTEKPKREEATSNWISAGTYIMESEVLDYIPGGQRYSVERALFPSLLRDGKPFYGYRSDAYWMDIGTPAKYLAASADLLTDRMHGWLRPEGEWHTEGVWLGYGTTIANGAGVTGPVLLGKDCHVAEGASITGPVVLGDGCRVGEGVRLEGMIALAGAQFDAGCDCRDCLIGNDARIGAGCRIEGLAIVGDKATVGAGNHLAAGVKVMPETTIADNTLFF
jgi:mannose-1-phosphate guanylyltransferase